jgi:hypothetical protein
MTDAKDVIVTPEWIAVVRHNWGLDTMSPHEAATKWADTGLPFSSIVTALGLALNHIDTLTRERDAALVMLGWTRESSLWQAAAEANQEVGHIRADWLALKAQLAAARVLLKSVPSALNAAFSAGAEEHENGSYRRQEKQMETVYAMRKAITAALPQEGA